jgi:hypothetical protein
MLSLSTIKVKLISKRNEIMFTKMKNLGYNADKKRLYLAYGSNLNMSQMAYRCPTAKPVGAAMIYGWELCFRGVADIIKSDDPQMVLPVGIWEISPADEYALDEYEGYRPDKPRKGLYDKIKVAGIMTYQMTRRDIAKPGQAYFKTILQGYRDFGLDTNYLYDAAGWAQYEEEQRDNVFGLESA